MKTRLARIAVFALAFGLALSTNAAEKQTVLYNFAKRSPTGWAPNSKLVMDAAGNLYGAASEGGVSTQCCGVIFELSPASGGGWTYNVIYTFTGQGDGAFPTGSLVMDAAGNLYGAGSGQSVGVNGEFFELSPNGSGGWTEKVLYAVPAADGGQSSPLVMDGSGNLYGANLGSGAHNAGYIFELSPGSGGAWTYQHLFDFNVSDGNFPAAGVILDAAGNLYGTTSEGGTSTNCPNGCGVVFELTQQSGTWSESVLYEFNGSNGSDPQAPLTLDAAGNLYGTTVTGGSLGFGIAFELKKNARVWKERVLHTFTQANGDGAAPNTGLVLRGGNLYGTTVAGGGGLALCRSFTDVGCGTAFELSPSGATWKETILYDFTGGKDGASPSGLILDASGNAFGIAASRGVANAGLIFELTPAK